jgi:cholinesterase
VLIPASVSLTSSRWYAISKNLGCGGEEKGAATLSCMRTKTSEQIVDMLKKTGNTGMVSSFGQTPDGKLVFEDHDYGKRLAEGNFAKIPLLIGNNDDEGGLTIALDKLTRRPKPGARKEKRQSPSSMNLECISGPTAAGRVKNGVPTWRYLFKGVYPNTDIGSKGAYHTAEIPMAFGTTASFSRLVSFEYRLK